MTRPLVAAAVVLAVLGAVGAAAWSPYFAVLFVLAGFAALAAVR